MSNLSRRKFLKSATVGVAASSALMFHSKPGYTAPSERVRHAVIGCGGRGGGHAGGFARVPGCEVVAICDVDPKNLEDAAENVPGEVAQYSDYRRLLEDQSIDSVSVATPDHWHTPIAMAALLAGKHVYVEKPCCHTIHEGKLLVELAEREHKCVQHGTQYRSGGGVKKAIQFMRDGNLGKVRAAKAINHQHRRPIGRAPVTDPPQGVDYDMWLGPAPVHDFTKNRWHYNWHWFWDYGTGDAGNDGAHQMDVARWGLGVDWPKVVNVSGGQLYYADDNETPDTIMATFEYDECQLIFEMRLWTDYKLEGHDNGVVFYGDKGTLEIGRRGCEVTLTGEDKEKIGGGENTGVNFLNFIECVKANDPSKLNAPIKEGFNSTALCLMANIGARLGGRRLVCDYERREFSGDPEASSLLSKEYRAGYELPFTG